MTDSGLIQEYARSRSNEAFKALVDQYVGLVYSACYRQLKDRHLAEDATQAVFILLSEKAGGLRQSYLTGWLLTTSRYACANIRKSQQRRQRREQVVAMNQTTRSEPLRNDLLDFLDEALCRLKASDREALVLRYLEQQPLSDVAEKLGISQEAARKRVERGVEKLRHYFSRRGIDATSGSIGALLTEQLSNAALTPAARHALTQGILQVHQAGLQSSAASVAIAKGTKTMMMLTQLKTAAVLAVIATIIGTGGWMISQVLADAAPATQASAPPSVPPTSQPIATLTFAAAPTPLPSTIDLSTPDSAARSFFTAVKDGDRSTTYACLTADPNRPYNMLDAVIAWNLAQNRLVKTVTQSFGGNGAGVKRLITLDEVADFLAQIPGGMPGAVINGNTASITITVPDSMMSSTPPDYRPILRIWSGKPLYFQKQGNQWKFDVDRSIQIDAKMLDKDKRPFDSSTVTAIFLEYVFAADEIAAAVRDGFIASAADASSALIAANSRIDQKHGLSSASAQIDIVPGK